jgi:hypothetical protein
MSEIPFRDPKPIPEFDNGERKTITEIWAWICEDTPGSEGLPGASIGGTFMPLIGSDRQRVESMRDFAVAVRIGTGRPVKLVRFTQREDVETLK